MSGLHYSDIPPTWISHPDAPGQALLGITIFLGITSILIMGLRLYARIIGAGLALDDWSMLVATCFYTVACVFACMGVYAGIGSKDDKQLSSWNVIGGGMWLSYWQIMYAWSLPFIKFSIGLTILRIAVQRVYRVLIWCIVGLSCTSCMIGFFAVVFVCVPMERSWMGELAPGHCADGVIITKISYLISVLAVITDWGCAIIPAIVVWGLQMKTKLKLTISIVLALGAVASAATIVRLPFLSLYNVTVNHLEGLAYIVIWSNIECGLGIIAGSLPSLRALLNFWLGKSTTDRSTDQRSGASAGRKTAPSSSRRATIKGGTANMTTCAAAEPGGDWIQLEDSESQKHIITATRDVTVQYEPRSRDGISRAGESQSGSSEAGNKL